MNELLAAFNREPWYWQIVIVLGLLWLVDDLLLTILSFRLTIVHKHIYIEKKECESTSK